MRSGRIQIEDRVVWVGDESFMPVGSSLKAYGVTRTHVLLNDYAGERDEHGEWPDKWARRGTEIVSCEEAGRRGIAPWDEVFPDGKVPPLQPRKAHQYSPPNIFAR